MATYRAVKGLEIQNQSSDPSNPVKGQVWYNTTAGVLKVTGAGAWSSGGSLLTASHNAYASNAGTQTACIVFGGGSSGSEVGPTQDYNG